MISLLRERRNRGLGEEMISVDWEVNEAVFAYEEALISAIQDLRGIGISCLDEPGD